MPSVNTLITAIVAGLAIGAHAGPCRPHGSSSSVSTAEVVTATSAQPSTTTSGSYPDVSSNLETKTTGTTGTAEASETETTHSASITSSSVTVSETTTDVGAHGSSESETTSTTAAETTSTTAVDTTSTSAQETTTAPSTTSSTAAPSTTSSTTAPSSTTADESTTQETTTLETRTSAASTTTSAAPSQTSGSSCPAAANLVCGKTGYLGDNSSSHLLDNQQDTDLETCKTRCKETENCVTIGYIADISQCELYDASPATLELTEDPDSWYAVYEACCFE